MRSGFNAGSKESQSSPFSNGSHNGVTSPGSRQSNGHSNGRAESNGSRVSNGIVPLQGLSKTWFGHDREEVARILIQSLTDLGYHHSAQSLSKESGFELEGPEVAAFRHSVLEGDWADAEAYLFGGATPDLLGSVGGNQGNGKAADYTGSWSNGRRAGLTLAEDANKDQMLFWLRQQKYLELLEKRDVGKALMVLRQELTPLGQDTGRLHQLSSLLMCKPEDLKQQSGWDGAAGESRSQLLSALSRSISPGTMIPESRLGVLLHQVKDGWIQNCIYHNTAESPSLYVDHTCDRSNFPANCVRTLVDHDDEVWYVGFSNSGKYLVTASSDKYVYIYDVTADFKKVHILVDHQSGVCHAAWSPDDTKLITCSREPDSVAKIWNVATGDCIAEVNHFQHAVSAATWAADSKTFVLGSQDVHNSLSVYRLAQNIEDEPELLYTWAKDRKMRIYDVAISPDQRKLVVLLEHDILVWDFLTNELIAEYAFERSKMTSVKIKSDSKHMLVSMSEHRISLMDIDTGETIQTYEGHKQKDYMIRSSFGGANESFVVSGSEDSTVYIWRITGHFVDALEACSPPPSSKESAYCVNAVSWHPKDPCMFASAGDDHKVRIWSNRLTQAPHSNDEGLSRTGKHGHDEEMPDAFDGTASPPRVRRMSNDEPSPLPRGRSRVSGRHEALNSNPVDPLESLQDAAAEAEAEASRAAQGSHGEQATQGDAMDEDDFERSAGPSPGNQQTQGASTTPPGPPPGEELSEEWTAPHQT